jgi:hypothetical protein
VWEQRDSGNFLAFQWIINACIEEEATIVLRSLKLSSTCENRGVKRGVVLSRLYDGV